MKITQFARILGPIDAPFPNATNEPFPVPFTDHLENFPEPEITETSIRIRLKNPDRFEQDSFRTITLTTGVQGVIARPKGATTTELQALIFDKDKFTPAEARAWVRRHKDSFSKATQLEQGKYDLFVYEGTEVSETNILELFEAHIEYHLPLFKPSGIEKILRVARINSDDLLESPQTKMQDELIQEEEEIVMRETRLVDSYEGESEVFDRIQEIERLLQKR